MTYNGIYLDDRTVRKHRRRLKKAIANARFQETNCEIIERRSGQTVI